MQVGDYITFIGYDGQDNFHLDNVCKIVKFGHESEVQVMSIIDNYIYPKYDTIKDFRLSTPEEIALTLAEKMK